MYNSAWRDENNFPMRLGNMWVLWYYECLRCLISNSLDLQIYNFVSSFDANFHLGRDILSVDAAEGVIEN